MKMTKQQQNSLYGLNKKAELYLTQGKLEEAIAACNQALEIVPDFPPIYKTLGNIFHKMGEIDKAKEWYLKAINQQPYWAEVHANLGSLYAKEKQWQLAIKFYQEAIGIKPNLPGFYRNLGKIWQQIGKIELARDCQEQALNLEAEYPQALEYLKLGKNLLENGEIESAIAYLQQAIKFHPFLANAYQKLGDALVEKKELHPAIKSYQQAIELKPDLWIAHHKLGKVFQEIGELDTAIIEFKLAIELNPNSPLPYKKLGEILENQKKLDPARHYYQKAIEIQPDAWNIHRKLNQIMLKQGKLKQAITACKVAIKLNQKLSWPYKLMGDIYQQNQEWHEAILAYSSALKLATNQDTLHKKLGDVLQKKGLIEEAIASYKKAIKINPNSCWHYGALGDAYVQQQKFSEAIPYLIQALKLRPDYDEVHKNIKYVLTKQGRQDAASIWSLEEKLPLDWLEKFFKLTGDWEIISSSLESNIIHIKIYPEMPVTFFVSQTIDAKLHPSFQEKKLKLVEAFIAIIPEGRGCVKLGTTAVISSDNKLVSDVSTGCATVIISSSQLPPIYYINKNVAFLSTKWGEKNYFHWIFDVVARIDLLRRTDVEIDKFILGSCEKKIHRESLEALGISQDKIIESRLYPHIKAKQLIVPSCSAKQRGIWVNKWSCEFLRSLFLKPQNIKELSHQPKRIYISRKLASWRRVLNEEEVMNLLEKFGFVSLTLESMSIAEQVSYMAAAKVVIAPHGAGLTNLVFCSPGTKVIEIFSPNYVNSLYWRISNFCSLSHYYLLGDFFDNDNLGKQLWMPDIIVNLKQLLKIMELAKVI
ncbi:tetratricopeptide repeat protein [Okeania sp. SIO1I7]|uniref:tetratricopeptide repeat protein n=1 Tax=Okeania sp. SIO1I7 TaxID=2607772 RepID=UPI0013F72937|nr:tetratricopeptide repeat protein [Okeania sp. SIO1I7]NET29177.1 tetratricopeptide repeat protein [Okeania sp. SIO1I7]